MHGANQFKMWFGLVVLWVVACAGATPEELLERAKVQAAAGDLNGSIIELKNALQQQPDMVAGRRLLGEVYLRAGDPLSSIKELSRAIELGDQSADLRATLLNARVAAGQFSAVLDELNKLSADAMDAAHWAARGDALLGVNDVPAARSAYESSLKLNDDLTAAHLGMARIGWVTNDDALAQREFARAMELGPNDPRLWITRAEFELSRKQFGESEASFRKAEEVALGLDRISAQIGIARALIAQAKWDDAKTIVTALLKQSPEFPMGNYFAALIEFQQNNIEVAEDHILTVLRSMPEHIPTVYLNGLINARQQKWLQAEQDLARVVNALPNDLQARKMLATVHIRQNQYDAALKVLEEGASIGENDPRYQAMIGSVLLRAGRSGDGMQALQRAATMAPDLPELRTQLALGHLAAGDSQGAVSELQQAANSSTDDVQSDLLLIMVQLRDKKFDEAMAEVERLLQERPKDPVIYNMKAAVLTARGDRAGALQALRDALRENPDFAVAKMNIAGMLVEDKNYDEATKLYTEVYQSDKTNFQSLLALAEIQRLQGRSDEGIKLLESARAESPNAIEPRLVLVRHYLATGAAAQALTIAEEALAARPNDNTRLAAVQARLANNKAAESVALIDQLLLAAPNNGAIHHELARAQWMLGNRAGANKSIEEAIKLTGSKYAPALVLGAQMALSQDNLPLAEIRVAALERGFADSWATRTIRADVEFVAKRYEAAAAAYAALFKENPSRDLLMKQANSIALGGQWPQAANLLGQWIAKNKGDAVVATALAQGHVERADISAGRATYEKFLEANPNNAVILNNLAFLYEGEDNNRGLQLALRALGQAQNNPEIKDTAGWFRVLTGDVDGGITLLREAADASTNPEISYHLAVALDKQGNKGEAKSVLQRILREYPNFPSRVKADALLKTVGG